MRPLLEYSASASSPHYIKDKDQLERVQYKFTKMVPGMKEKPYKERLQKQGIWSPEECRNRADLLEMLKIYQKDLLLKSEYYFISKPTKELGRHHTQVMKRFSRSDPQKRFSVKG